MFRQASLPIQSGGKPRALQSGKPQSKTEAEMPWERRPCGRRGVLFNDPNIPESPILAFLFCYAFFKHEQNYSPADIKHQLDFPFLDI